MACILISKFNGIYKLYFHNELFSSLQTNHRCLLLTSSVSFVHTIPAILFLCIILFWGTSTNTLTMWTLLTLSVTFVFPIHSLCFLVCFFFFFSVSSNEILSNEIYFLLFCIFLLFKLDTILFLSQTSKYLSGVDSGLGRY